MSPIAMEYVPNGLAVRSQRTKSSFPTDYEYVPYNVLVNPRYMNQPSSFPSFSLLFVIKF